MIDAIQYTLGPSLMRLCPSETIRAARMLITSPYLWTQNSRARDSNGRKCRPNDPDATQWSINGAIAVVSNPQGITPPYLIKCLDQLVTELGLCRDPDGGPGSVDQYNDDTGHNEILNLLDTAHVWLKENGH